MNNVFETVAFPPEIAIRPSIDRISIMQVDSLLPVQRGFSRIGAYVDECTYWKMSHRVLGQQFAGERCPYLQSQIYAVTRGRGALRVGQTRYELTPGVVIMVPCGTVRQIYNIGHSSPLEFWLIHTDADRGVVDSDIRAEWIKGVQFPDGTVVEPHTFSQQGLSVFFAHIKQELEIVPRETLQHIYVISGAGKIVTPDGIKMQVKAGEGIKISSSTPCTFINRGSEDLFLVTVHET